MAERESSLAERERKDAEKAAAIKERQIRLGHIEKPKSKKNGPKAKPAAEEVKEDK